MWADYFSEGQIYGVDICDKSKLELPKNVNIFQGAQTDSVFLTEVLDRINPPDIIVDDASHINPYTIKSFEILFPKLSKGGVYFIEDLETSYRSEEPYIGTINTHNLHEASTMNYFKHLTDVLNYKSILDFNPDFKLFEEFRDKIASITFHRQLIVIQKA